MTPSAYTMDWQDLGAQLYVHDRQSGETMFVASSATASDAILYSLYPDFSDSGHLAFSTNAPNLVEGDTDVDEDVFVFNVFTRTHTRVHLTHEGAPLLTGARNPAISSNGRYIAFVGIDRTPEGIEWRNVYGVDLESNASYDVSVTPEGQRVGVVNDAPAMSADGSAIAFLSAPFILPEYQSNESIFVATALSISPRVIDVSPTGGTVLLDVNAPANTAWAVTIRNLSMEGTLPQIMPMDGVGAGTLQLSLPPNHTPDLREYWVIVGSEYVVVRQGNAPMIWSMSPESGPMSGGIEISIFGMGFAADATVTVGGHDATIVAAEYGAVIRALTPAADRAGWVEVVVTNPSGGSATYWFHYLDPTPPVITSQVTGNVGSNGWYTSDVRVQWTVEDAESSIEQKNCPFVNVTADSPAVTATCTARSEGGAVSRQLTIKRDATAPELQILTPENRVYAQHAVATVSYSCSDHTSGVASCAGTQPSGLPLDTTTPGTFAFTVTAEDGAGLKTTRAVSYTVKAATALQIASVTAPFGATTSMRATLVAGGAPLEGAVVTFLANGEIVGSAMTTSSGEASLVLALPGRDVGSVNIEARYEGGDYAFPSSGTAVLTITKASTEVVLTTTPNPSRPNRPVQLQAVVSVVAPGSGTATGFVLFREDGDVVGAAALINGMATFEHSFKHGTHTVTAMYVGSAAFDGSSASVTHRTE